MKLNSWYISEIEKCYIYAESENRVKYIALVPGVPPRVRNLDIDKGLWLRWMPVSSGIKYYRECMKAVFRGY